MRSSVISIALVLAFCAIPSIALGQGASRLHHVKVESPDKTFFPGDSGQLVLGLEIDFGKLMVHGFDPAASTVVSLVDDKGRDLLAVSKARVDAVRAQWSGSQMTPADFDPYSFSISEQGPVLRVSVTVHAVPEPGAQSLTLVGKIAVRVPGKDRVTLKLPNTTLGLAQPVEVDGHKVEQTEYGYESEASTIRFKSDLILERLILVVGDKKFEGKPAGSSWSGQLFSLEVGKINEPVELVLVGRPPIVKHIDIRTTFGFAPSPPLSTKPNPKAKD